MEETKDTDMSLEGLRSAASRMGGSGKSKSKGSVFALWKPPSFTQSQPKLTHAQMPHFAVPIVFIPGEYPDFYNEQEPGRIEDAYHWRFHSYVHHAQSGGRSFQSYRKLNCLSGPNRHAPKPCIGCLKVDQKEWDEKQYSTRSMFLFNIAHLVRYHEMPLVKNGQIQYRQDDASKPVMIKKECHDSCVASTVYWANRGDNKPCDGCQQNSPVVLGGHRYMELGKNHLNDVIKYNRDVLSKRCLTCGGGLAEIGFMCQDCGTLVVDFATCGMTNQDIDNFRKSPFQCRSCGANGLPIPKYDCGYDDQGFTKVSQGCQDPKPVTLYDVVVWMQREGEGTGSSIAFKKYELITHSPSFPGQDGQPSDLTEHLKTVVPRPFDFDSMFEQTTAEQAKRLDQPDPYGPQQSQQNFHNYDQGVRTVAPITQTIPPPQAPQPGPMVAPPMPQAPQPVAPQQSVIPAVPVVPQQQPQQPAVQAYPVPPSPGGRPPWSTGNE